MAVCMKILFRNLCIALLMAVEVIPAIAQTKSSISPWEVNAQAGILFGATAPIPIPKVVEKTYTWYPNLNPSVGVVVTRRLEGKFSPMGFFAGLSWEYKGMDATTGIKDLNIVVRDGENVTKGIFNGYNLTSVRNGYLSVPLGVSYYFRNKVTLCVEAGVYTSLLLHGKFATIIDGQMLPENMESSVELELYEFDFSDRITPVDFGGLLNFYIYPWERMGFLVGLRLGSISVVRKDFDMIPFKLYNAYSCIGFTYRLSN